jgi:hypothetical protein
LPKRGKKAEVVHSIMRRDKKIGPVLLTIHFGRGNRFDEAVGIIFENLFVF